MTKVTKEKNWGTNDVIIIQTKEGCCYISFEKDMNLYFSYSGNKLEDAEGYYRFMIDKENAFLCEKFDELFDAITSQKPFKSSKNLNRDYGHSLLNFQNSLFKDGVIEWHSDEAEYDLSSILYIEKNDNGFLVTFKKGNFDEFDRFNYRVCIKSVDSRYDPYNTSFMIMYNDLNEHDFELEGEKTKNKVRQR